VKTLYFDRQLMAFSPVGNFSNSVCLSTTSTHKMKLAWLI